MSTFKQKKELKEQIAAAKKAGKSNQTIGRLQYKLNQLTADPKGNAVRTKTGKVVKTGTGGTVRQKPKANLPKKKPTVRASVKLTPKPKPKSNVTTYPLPSAKITRVHDYPKKPTRHPYTKLTTLQLKRKANSGDKRAKAILDIRLGK